MRLTGVDAAERQSNETIASGVGNELGGDLGGELNWKSTPTSVNDGMECPGRMYVPAWPATLTPPMVTVSVPTVPDAPLPSPYEISQE